MFQSFQKTIEEKTGVKFDEIIDGYKFVGKEEQLFVFMDPYEHLIKLTIEAVRSEIRSKVEIKKNDEIFSILNQKGIFRMNFNIFNYTTQKKDAYRVSQVSSDSDYITLQNTNNEERVVHFSLLQNEQTILLVQEARNLEDSFSQLELAYILKRIKTICEQVFHPLNQSNKANDIHPTLLRLKVLMLEKLEAEEINIKSLNQNQLNDLIDEINFSKSLVDPSNQRLINAFERQEKLLKKKIEQFELENKLSCLNSSDLHEIFEPNSIKNKIIELLDHSELEIQNSLQALLLETYENIEEITGMTFKRVNLEIKNIDEFLDSIFNLQSRYVNSQLKVGRDDINLINRFNVIPNKDRLTFSILENFEGITDKERLKILRELIDHRLLLLFQNGFDSTDEYFRKLAYNNVLEFYKIFYGIL